LQPEALPTLMRFANLEIDRSRKEYQRELTRRADLEYAYSVPDGTTPGAALIAELQTSTNLGNALATLERSESTPLLLHYYEDFTHREIAILLDMERSTVTRRINRALEKVRTYLQNLEHCSLQSAA
jgi:RNA polymerase sigma factor (sigma-70 family)